MGNALIRAALTFVVLVSLTGLARAQGVDLGAKQALLDTLDDPVEVRLFRIMAIEGDLLTLKVSPVKKTGLVPVVDLLGPGGRVDLPAAKQGRLKARKLPLPATGMYLLTVTGAGTTGDYKLSVKRKSARIAPVTVTVPGEVPIVVPRDGLLTVRAAAAKGSGV